MRARHLPCGPALLAAAAVLLLAGGCAHDPAASDAGDTAAPLGAPVVSSAPVRGDGLVDLATDRWLEPWRGELRAFTGEILGRAAVPLAKARPEGTLGNWAADAVLAAAPAAFGEEADFALLNHGGLRVDLPAGPVTYGQVIEVYPFENVLALATLSGADVVALADAIAARGGDPVAGLSLTIGPRGAATDVRVRGQPVRPDRTYRMVTHDFIVTGGDRLLAGLALRDVRTSLVKVREVLVDDVRRRAAAGEELRPALDGRIRAVAANP